MQAPNSEPFPPPPGVIGSIRQGFDAVAMHITAILLPLALDLLLWFGPRLSVKEYYQAILPRLEAEWRSLGFSATQIQTAVEGYRTQVGYLDGLNALQSRGHEVALIHILSPDEVNPPLAGDLRLVDVETAAGQDVTLDAPMRDLYQRRLVAWREDVSATCRARGVHYVTVETAIPWEEVILYQLRRVGVVR